MTRKVAVAALLALLAVFTAISQGSCGSGPQPGTASTPSTASETSVVTTAPASSSTPSSATTTAPVGTTSAPAPSSTAPGGSAPLTSDEGIDPGGKEAVLAFLSALAEERYADAASLFGDLDFLLSYPGADPPAKLAAAVRLLVVLPPRYVRTEAHAWLQEVWVQLIQPDGTAYVHIPPVDTPDELKTEFMFYTVKVNGRWWVMSLPPYHE